MFLFSRKIQGKSWLSPQDSTCVTWFAKIVSRVRDMVCEGVAEQTRKAPPTQVLSKTILGFYRVLMSFEQATNSFLWARANLEYSPHRGEIDTAWFLAIRETGRIGHLELKLKLYLCCKSGAPNVCGQPPRNRAKRRIRCSQNIVDEHLGETVTHGCS